MVGKVSCEVRLLTLGSARQMFQQDAPCLPSAQCEQELPKERCHTAACTVQCVCESAECWYAPTLLGECASHTNTHMLPCGMQICWPDGTGCGVRLQEVFQSVTLANLCLFYVTAPPSGEMTVQQSLGGMKPEIGRAQ